MNKFEGQLLQLLAIKKGFSFTYNEENVTVSYVEDAEDILMSNVFLTKDNYQKIGPINRGFVYKYLSETNQLNLLNPIHIELGKKVIEMFNIEPIIAGSGDEGKYRTIFGELNEQEIGEKISNLII